MRAAFVVPALLVGLGTAAYAADDQAYLGIFAETSVMKMAGMPAMPELPKNLPPALANNPMFSMGKPTRKLTVRLWSPGLAPDNATASIAVPEGLKQGPKLDLELYRPKPEEGTTGGDTNTPGDIPQPPDMTIKIYWGSSATVKPGQPVIIKLGDLTPEQKAMMRRATQRAQAASRAQKGAQYFYKPDWTTGYWPTDKQPGAIAADAALQGDWALTTSYTGNVTLPVPAEVNFLAGIEMSSPDLSQQVDRTKAIEFQWKQIPNLLGSHARVMGMEGRNTIVLWSSSEVREEMGTDWDFLQMAEVRDMVKRTVMMAGDRTSVTVPEGIFKDCDMSMFNMVGYGPGAALAAGQPLPRCQTKTSLQIMLGGNGMRGFGGPGGGRRRNNAPPPDGGDSDQ